MAEPSVGDEAPDDKAGFARVRVNLYLFLATVVSVFFAGALYRYLFDGGRPPEGTLALVRTVLDPRTLVTGWTFAVPLLAILVAHEFGHYFAALIHRVPASLPYFIPLPLLSPFGTMGAVIAMPDRIRSRNALLDIGAAGPLAGLVVAIPVLAIGILNSPVGPLPTGDYTQEGQSLVYVGLKYLVLGPIPAGSDVNMHPTALAGWAGLLVTMINLLPFGQLDGGHIAYALFGKKQDRIAFFIQHFLIALFLYNVAVFIVPVLRGTSRLEMGEAVMNSTFWLVWYAFLWLLAGVSGRAHPPFEPGPLSPARRVVAWLCLALFVGLFMPTPWAEMR
jgi:membrane-associated protease RseP (regulator of RpoE activity)